MNEQIRRALVDLDAAADELDAYITLATVAAALRGRQSAPVLHEISEARKRIRKARLRLATI